MGFFNERLLEIAMFTFVFTIFATGILTVDAAISNPPVFDYINLPNNYFLEQFRDNYLKTLNTSNALDGGITQENTSTGIWSLATVIPDWIESATNWTVSVLLLLAAFVRNAVSIGTILTTPLQALFDVFGISAIGSMFVSLIASALNVIINILNLRFLVALWRGV